MKYRIGTRGSKLALKQTNDVIARLEEAYPEDEFEVVVITTTGDKEQKKSLDQIGSKGVFVQEIEEELLNGTIHAAVHSMKDMPAEAEEGLVFTKAWKREDERDVLVLREAASLDELPERAVIGTGSKRRAFQLLKVRPDIKIVGIRGNIDTRLKKLHTMQEDGTYMDGIILAAAGLKRLGMDDIITQYLSVDDMIPAPAQGTLAIEIKGDNYELLEKFNRLSDEETELTVQAERGFLKAIGGDCHLPVAAFCDRPSDKELRLRALFGDEEGTKLARAEVTVSCDSEAENEDTIVKAADIAVTEIVEAAMTEIQNQLENCDS